MSQEFIMYSRQPGTRNRPVCQYYPSAPTSHSASQVGLLIGWVLLVACTASVGLVIYEAVKVVLSYTSN